MNFKEILETWENLPHNKHEQTDTRSIQERWLSSHGISDKDALRDTSDDAENRVQANGPSKKELERLPLDAELDLHGYTSVEAGYMLEDFFSKAERNGWKKVSIIHGKGNHSKDGSVLARFVQVWLETCPSAGRRMTPPAKDGGTGTIIVFIKRKS